MYLTPLVMISLPRSLSLSLSPVLSSCLLLLGAGSSLSSSSVGDDLLRRLLPALWLTVTHSASRLFASERFVDIFSSQSVLRVSRPFLLSLIAHCSEWKHADETVLQRFLEASFQLTVTQQVQAIQGLPVVKVFGHIYIDR